MEMRRASSLPAKLPPHSLEVVAINIEAGEAEPLIIEVGDVESTASVHNDDEEIADAPALDHTSNRLFRLCRLFGVDFLYFHFYELKGSKILEPRKVVLVQDLRSACYASLLHILPVSACMLLTVFNWNGYYIGGEISGPQGQDDLKFLGLQFVAKILELMSMASLSCILFSVIRQQLIDGVLPFGAVTSGFEFSRISLLWSKEFIATCSAGFGTALTKTFIIATIIIFTLLGASMGPSAAVASQPTLRDWSAGGTEFYLNATIDQLFPLELDEVVPSELSCSDEQSNDGTCFPSNYNLFASEILAHWPSSISAVTANHFPPVIPENTLITGRNSVQRFSNRLIGGFIYNPGLTTATTPMAFVSDAVATLARYWFIANQSLCIRGITPSFCYYRDIANSIETVQPVSYVRCTHNTINSTLSFVRLDQDGTYPLVKLENSTYGSREEFDAAIRNSSQSGLTWISLPELIFGSTSLGAIVALPGSNRTTDPGYFLTCTIDARWVNSTAALTFLGGPMVVAGSFSDYTTSDRFKKDSKGQLLWPRISVTARWAEHLNPTTSDNQTTVFDLLTKSVARMGNIAQVPHSLNAVEAVLALMVTEGISRVGNSATIQGSLKGMETNDWWKHILPGGHVFGKAGSAFDFVSASGDTSAKLTMETTVTGYGYGPTTATVLSIAVLMTYSVIAISYVLYSSSFTRTTSSAWESISELVALAVNSPPTAALRNTGAGVSTLGALKKPVWIRPRNGDLELTFEKREKRVEGKELDVVEPNESYG